MPKDTNTLNLVALPGDPWLITESGLEQILRAQGTVSAKDLSAVLARRGDAPADLSSVELRDGLAILSVTGPILRYGGGVLSWFFDVTGIEDLARDFARVQDDPAVRAIVLNVDSPGGQVSGTNEFADMVYAARGRKPIVAYVNATAASAAYWIASAADRIVVDPTAAVGSIGVVATTYGRDKDAIEIVNSASPKKRLDPATDSGRAEILKTVDAIADVFIARVARNRGVSEDTVLARYGQGGVLVGAAAVDAGLADAVGSLEGVLGDLAATNKHGSRGGFNMKKFTNEELAAALEQIRAEAPGMLDAALDAARKEGLEAGLAQGRGEGQAAERARVVEIIGAEAERAVTVKAISDGTAASDFFKVAYQAERDKRAQGLQQLQQQATPPMGSTPPADGGKGFDALVQEYMDAHKCKKSAAIQAVMRDNPEAHKAWLAGKQK